MRKNKTQVRRLSAAIGLRKEEREMNDAPSSVCGIIAAKFAGCTSHENLRSLRTCQV
jgi:hypothetical protein